MNRSHFAGGLAFLVASPWLFAVAPPPSKAAVDKKAEKAIREVAGTAEFLRSLPKRFGTLVRVDLSGRKVTLRFDGDKSDREWPLTEDAEIKVEGWWGRLDQLVVGERIWAWLKTNRKNQPAAVAMLADDISQQDMQGAVTVKLAGLNKILLAPEKGPDRALETAKAEAYTGARKVDPNSFPIGTKLFVRGKGSEALLLLDAAALELRRAKQRDSLRQRWLSEGLPGNATFLHVFSGEMDLMLDHEAMRWGRSLTKGDKVTLVDNPPIQAVVKNVQPWRERTLVRLVAKSEHLADLRMGQRLFVKMKPPPVEVEASQFPPDIGRPRPREERIEWFLASVYCTCGVRGDTCTGHFYTLASCNPNGCGQPNLVRSQLGKLIDQGRSDRQIFEQLLKEQGPGLLQPHLLP